VDPPQQRQDIGRPVSGAATVGPLPITRSIRKITSPLPFSYCSIDGLPKRKDYGASIIAQSSTRPQDPLNRRSCWHIAHRAPRLQPLFTYTEPCGSRHAGAFIRLAMFSLGGNGHFVLEREKLSLRSGFGIQPVGRTFLRGVLRRDPLVSGNGTHSGGINVANVSSTRQEEDDGSKVAAQRLGVC